MGCHASNFRYEELDDKPDKSQTLFGRLTFGFLSGIIQTGNKRPLEEADLFPLEFESTRFLTTKLEGEWQNEVKVKGKSCSPPRLWKAVLKTVDINLITMVVILTILSCFCRLVQPVVLSFLLEEMTTSTSSDSSSLFLHSALLFSSSLVQTFAVHHIDYAMYLLAVQIKASLIGIVYKKVGGCQVLVLY